MEVQQLLQLIDESFERKAWHGTNLRGSIRGLTVGEAAWCPAPGRHNIWEVLVHCAYWKYAIRRRLSGEKKGSFPLKGSNWFKRPVELTERAWRSDVDLLEEMHQSLRAAVAELTAADLKRNPSGSKWTNLQAISGIASHDIYHAGQIQLLKRLQKK